VVQVNDERWRANLIVARDAGQLKHRPPSIAWRRLVGGWQQDSIDKAVPRMKVTAIDYYRVGAQGLRADVRYAQRCCVSEGAQQQQASLCVCTLYICNQTACVAAERADVAMRPLLSTTKAREMRPPPRLRRQQCFVDQGIDGKEDVGKIWRRR
jgi:hypothetical protein